MQLTVRITSCLDSAVFLTIFENVGGVDSSLRVLRRRMSRWKSVRIRSGVIGVWAQHSTTALRADGSKSDELQAVGQKS